MGITEKDSESIVQITNGDVVLGVLLHHSFDKPGITFVTPDDYTQQMAYMHHPKGHKIIPHIHNCLRREVLYTREAIIVKKGRMRCDFFSEEKDFVKSIILETGDILLLVSGGHGFECLEETLFVEIKQGPYLGEHDKTRF